MMNATGRSPNTTSATPKASTRPNANSGDSAACVLLLRSRRGRSFASDVLAPALGTASAASRTAAASRIGTSRHAVAIPATVAGGQNVLAKTAGRRHAPTAWLGDHTATAVPGDQVVRTQIEIATATAAPASAGTSRDSRARVERPGSPASHSY